MHNQASSESIGQLRKLLNYWLEHNAEHAEEFVAWAEKITVEKPQVAELLKSAASQMSETNVFLERAIELLK